jgi:non-ribosomal peptide synthetase component E (peptide arylation enzyme)
VRAVVEQPPGAEPLTLAAVTAFLRAEGLAVRRPPERLERVAALPRGETPRKVLTYRPRERFAGG